MAVVKIGLEAQKQFDALPTVVRARVERIFLRLQNWPSVSGAKPLRGKLSGRYRIRTGDYRMQFRIKPAIETKGSAGADVVLIERIGHRDKIYDE